MANWFVTTKGADFQKIAGQFQISPVLARIIRNREVRTEEEYRKYLYGTAEDLYDPFLMKDMQKAVSLLEQAVKKKQKIRVIGDYDADGICSSYILYHGLKSLGADVDTAIPHRVKDGYGLNDRLITEAGESGIELIITCDNGIAAADQIRMAKEMGIRTIVTDHHEVPFLTEEDGRKTQILPEADAVIDPRQEGCGYPFKGICGAVVAWKFLQAAGVAGEVLQECMEPAAFATICDVMELRDENRILVKAGLQGMRHTRNAGLKALMDVCGIAPDRLEAYHIGFVLGPCMNATGRLESAEMALQLWKCEKREEAVRLAAELKELNDSRKEMTEFGLNEAVRIIEEEKSRKGVKEQEDKVLVVFLPDCHESIAGIVAGRIREKYGRPAFVLTRAEEGVKGSGRSVEAYDMYAAISACRELFTKFGGHKMAAGLSLPEENIPLLRQYLNAHCTLQEEDFESRVLIDVPLPLSQVTEKLVEELRLLEPFGVGNAKPVFAQKNVRIQRAFLLGKNRNVVRFQITDENGRPMEMVYFGEMEKLQDFLKKRFGNRAEELFRQETGGICFSVTYYPSVQEYRGRRSLQIVMTDFC